MTQTTHKWPPTTILMNKPTKMSATGFHGLDLIQWFLDEWISGSVFLMSRLCKHKYMYLFRANKGRQLFRHFPFLSQFMLIQVFVPIYVNSSVGISWDDSRHSLKHGQPDERINLDENNYEFVLDTSPIDLTSTPWLNAMEDGMQMIKYVLVHIRHFCNKKPSHRLEHLFELIPCVEPICNCL